MRKKIYLNARFRGSRLTGVERFGREITARLLPLLAQDGRFQPLALQPGKPAAGGRAVLWEQLVLPLRAHDGYLVNFCNTAPLAVRRQLAVVHDASVFAVPENYSLGFRTWYRIALNVLLRRAEIVVTVSSFSRSELSRYCEVPPERIEVIHCGCDHLEGVAADAAILERAGLSRGRYLLAVGTPSRSKNLGLLIEAMARLHGGGLELAVVGESEPRVFEANRIEWPQGSRLLGNVTDAELKALYEHALCFAFPSRYEGFGLPPLEAMRCGCPVIVSSAASLPEVCGDAALYIDPDDAHALAGHIRSLIESAAQRESLRARGYAQSGRFTWSAAAGKYHALIAAAAGQA